MVKILENFTGYPAGVKRRFTVGETPAGLPSDYEALLVAKGLAAQVRERQPARRETTDK